MRFGRTVPTVHSADVVADFLSARTIRPLMFRHVPNALTLGRLLLACIFFCLLAYYQYQGRGDPHFLRMAFGIYVIALVTDFLDGYLARKWNVEGAFGRVVDPFVDKVLVLGTFIFFAGKNFILVDKPENTLFLNGLEGFFQMRFFQSQTDIVLPVAAGKRLER